MFKRTIEKLWPFPFLKKTKMKDVLFVNEKLEDGSRVTIDKDNHITLREVYWGGAEPFARFELTAPRKYIVFEASWKTENLKIEKGMIVKWEVYKVNLNMIKKCKPEIVELIREALSSHGLTGSTDRVKETIVTFTPSLYDG